MGGGGREICARWRWKCGRHTPLGGSVARQASLVGRVGFEILGGFKRHPCSGSKVTEARRSKNASVYHRH